MAEKQRSIVTKIRVDVSSRAHLHLSIKPTKNRKLRYVKPFLHTERLSRGKGFNMERIRKAGVTIVVFGVVEVGMTRDVRMVFGEDDGH